MLARGGADHHSISTGFIPFYLLLLVLLLLYLLNLNRLLSTTPADVKRLVPRRWTRRDVSEKYQHLRRHPVTTVSYASQLPAKLHRRYVVTGGSGLVGGYIVLQLLQRGQPPESIRIVDFQPPHRSDQLDHPLFASVDFQQANIASAASTEAAFAAPWHASVAKLPLTVFHTAAVIVASARSELVNEFCEAVNVQGTRNVLESAQRTGADVLVSTSSASISIVPVDFWPAPWRRWNSCLPHAWQLLDESDFFSPIRPHRLFFGNYPASKAKAERIVCGANSQSLRTGAVRPANGVYGHPTDNTVGGPLNIQPYPSWTSQIVQSFVHGINCAVAHLQFEAILAHPQSHSAPQAGRPFCVTDPNGPIYYGDLYMLIAELASTPFTLIKVPPLPMLLLSYLVEFYSLLPVRLPGLARILPPLSGHVKHLQPGLFSICTHLFANNAEASKPVDQGGLGYRGILTTLEGMCQELRDWNDEQERHASKLGRVHGRVVGAKHFQSSLAQAEEFERTGAMAPRHELLLPATAAATSASF